jgi:hypothetical protein
MQFKSIINWQNSDELANALSSSTQTKLTWKPCALIVVIKYLIGSRGAFLFFVGKANGYDVEAQRTLREDVKPQIDTVVKKEKSI